MILVKRIFGIPVIGQFADCWRACGAALAMFDALKLSQPFLPTVHHIPDLLVNLILSFGVGAVSYIATLLILWLASGKPSGIEATASRMVLAMLGRSGRLSHAVDVDPGDIR